MPNDNADQIANDTTATEATDVAEEKVVSPETEDTGNKEQELIEKPVQSEKGRNRVEELANERNFYKSEYEKLIGGQTPADSSPDIIGNLEKQLDSLQPEYTGDWVQDLEKVRTVAKEEAKAELKAELKFEREISEVEKSYPELDATRPDADQKLIGLINKQWKLAGGLKSGQSFKKFVGEIMEIRQGAISKGKEQTLETLSEQLSTQAVTPGTSGSKETKSFNEMSLKELESMAGYAE